MHVSNNAAIDSASELYDDADSAGRDGVTVLEELLAHSIQLRDLYKYGRLHAADMRFRHLFHSHYREQLRVVDVLIDRIRMLGGSGHVFASDFLQDAASSCKYRGRWSPTGLVHALLERHELGDLQAWSISDQSANPHTRHGFNQI